MNLKMIEPEAFDLEIRIGRPEYIEGNCEGDERGNAEEAAPAQVAGGKI